MKRWWKQAAAAVVGMTLGFGGTTHAQYVPTAGPPGYPGVPGMAGPQAPVAPMPPAGPMAPYPPGGPMAPYGPGGGAAPYGPGGAMPFPPGGPMAPMPPGGPMAPQGPMGPMGPMPPGGPTPPSPPADKKHGGGDDGKIPELPSGPNAFQGECYPREDAWYVSAGGLGLQRSLMPHKAVSQLSIPVATGATTTQTGTIQLPVTFAEGNGQIATGSVPVVVNYTAPVYNAEEGRPFLSGAPTAGDYHDAHQTYAWGVSAAVGLIADDRSSLEFSGFYLPQHGSPYVVVSPHFSPSPSSITVNTVGAIPNPGGAIISTGSIAQAIVDQLPVSSVGRLNLPFVNAPAGFEGNNGLWTEADRVSVNLKTTMGNAEANYRLRTDIFLQPIFGVRYLDQEDRLSIYTEDDVFSNPDPKLSANYIIHTHNRLATGQLGMGWDVPVFRWLSISGFLKGAWGANIVSTEATLVRGDGLVGFDQSRQVVTFGQIYEGGAFIDFYFLERARLRAGYQFLWMPTVARGIDQIDYDLSNPLGNRNYHRSEFYHGPSISLEFLF